MTTSWLSAYVGVAKLWHRVARRIRRAAGIKKTVYVQERVPFFRELWRAAAADVGFQFVALTDSMWEVRDGERRVARLNNYIVSLDDPVTLDMAGDKLLTYRLFAAAGLTIPRYISVQADSLQRIAPFLADVAGPYAVKPARNTSSGLGVTTNVRTLPQCLRAVALALTYCDEVLIEEHVVGESYRLLYLGQKLISAARRTGLRVIGDGKSTLRQLLTHQHPGWSDDPDVRLTIAKQGLDVDSVPGVDREILVRSAGKRREGEREVRTVYTEEVTAELCPEIVEEGRRASSVLGSEFCGVDLITVDPSVPLASGKGRITEINTTPGLHHHYGLDSSAPQPPLAQMVLRYAAAKSR